MKTRPYQVCVHCCMDTSDPKIKFDEQGRCNHCLKFDANLGATVRYGEHGSGKLAEIVFDAKQHSNGYDCVIGLSGGVDSSYTAYIVKEKMGLNSLAVTLDNGWNTPESENNVKELVRILGINLYPHVIDFREMRSLEMAYLRASVLNLEATSDHAIVALLWITAATNGIPYILTGHNYLTEYILPLSWRYQSTDLTNILDIHRKYGDGVALRTFPKMSSWKLAYYQDIKKIKIDYPLNYLPEGYNKAQAKEFLKKNLNWQDYGGKHYESVITRFFQGYICPTKWGIDKRRCHLSTLVCAGQMTRGEAMTELDKPPYPLGLLEQDKALVCQKLGIPERELDYLIGLPNRQHAEFDTDARAVKQIERLRRFRRRLQG